VIGQTISRYRIVEKLGVVAAWAWSTKRRTPSLAVLWPSNSFPTIFRETRKPWSGWLTE
jgi:hypothetical protein